MKKIIPSKKLSDADNQQERLKTIGWIVGYVDGEGCFSVSLIKNYKTKFGWQVFPEFVVTQGEKSLYSLKFLKRFFGCGKIFVNRRHDNHKENIYRYCIRSLNDLNSIIVPFFKLYKLKTAKKNDFEKFAKILNLMQKDAHSNQLGLCKIAHLIEQMNRKKPSKFLKSSETTR